MKTYIALLRGINVSGKHKIIMASFKELLCDSGFKNVTTYIQSGNVIFDAQGTNKIALEKKISAIIKSNYNYDVPVIIKTPEEIEQLIKDNPFLKEANVNLKSLYITFLQSEPSSTNQLDSLDFGNDKYILKKDIMYVKYENGAGKTKLNNKIVESKLNVRATSRNWRTTQKLHELSKK